MLCRKECCNLKFTRIKQDLLLYYLLFSIIFTRPSSAFPSKEIATTQVERKKKKKNYAVQLLAFTSLDITNQGPGHILVFVFIHLLISRIFYHFYSYLHIHYSAKIFTFFSVLYDNVFLSWSSTRVQHIIRYPTDNSVSFYIIWRF